MSTRRVPAGRSRWAGTHIPVIVRSLWFWNAVGAVVLLSIRNSSTGRDEADAVGVSRMPCQEDHRLQPIVVAARGQIPQQDRCAFLALDFAPVDVALDVDAQLPGPLHRGGSRVIRTDHRQRQAAFFVGRPERREVDTIRCLVDRFHERDDVGVAAGLCEVRFLGTVRMASICDAPFWGEAAPVTVVRVISVTMRRFISTASYLRGI